MNEKKPQAGEFWEWAGERLRIIGTRNDGRIVGENQAGGLEMSCHIFDMTHLPDCDSFDWQPETFPQFYRGDRWSNYDAYVRFDSADKCGTAVYVDGKEQECKHYIFADIHECIRLDSWKKLTQAEAESRVKKPEPVESPDDWVTQDRVPDRPGIDQWRRVWPRVKPDDWQDSSHSSSTFYKHGDTCRISKSVFEVRCRRKDLPPLPQETPKREYVRCFTTLEGTVRTAKDISEFDMPTLWHELKHDGTGFYLEDGK